MEPYTAVIDPAGTCRCLDDGENLEYVEILWPSIAEWVQAWIAEQRSERPEDRVGPAWRFIHYATRDAIPGVVDALVELSEAVAADEDLLSMVGCGPLEDLISHSGNGALVLDEVDRAARRSPPFRAALRSVYLSDRIPAHVTRRLLELRD